MILFLKQVVWTSLISNTSSLVTILSTAFLARYISPETFGIYIFCIAIREIISGLCSPSTSQAYLFSEGKLNDLKVVCKINFFFSLFVVLVTFFTAEFINSIYNISYYHIILLFGFLSVINSYSSIFLSISEKQMDFKKTSFIRSWASIAGAIFACAIAFTIGDDIKVLVYKEIIFSSVLFLFSVIYRPNLLSNNNNNNKKFLYILKYSLRSYFPRLTEVLSYKIFEIITGNFLGKNILGSFSQTLNLIKIPYKFLGSITDNILFVYLKKFKKNDNLQSFCLIQDLIFLLTIPIILFFNIFNELIVYIVLGPLWLDISKIIGLGSMFLIILPFYNSLITVYQAFDNQRFYTASNCLILIIQIISVNIFQKNIEIFLFYYCLSFLFSTIFLTININKNKGFEVKKIANSLIIITLVSFIIAGYHFYKFNFLLFVPFFIWLYILNKNRHIIFNYISKWKSF